MTLGLLVGCYDPAPQTEIPCGDNDACPHGQRCIAGLCRTGIPDGLDAPVSDADPGDGASDGSSDAPTDTTMGACAGGDNACLVSCVATDPDCMTTCGDNRCVGNAGELCSSCAADCNTTAAVCGNGQCQAGESPDCFADCGPTPWTWAAEEAQLLALVQNARTSGFACPSMTSVTRPAFTVSAALLPPAREWVWEMSHHNYFGTTAQASCNGRSAAQREADGGFTGYVRSAGYDTVQAAFNAWMASASQCPIVMSTASMAAIAVSFDTRKSFILVLK